MSSTKTRIRCEFHPQAWQRDQAVEVDAQGPTTWDMDVETVPHSRSDAADALRNSPNAPEWVRRWSGPFDIEVTPIETPQAPLGDAQRATPPPDPSQQAGARPWHTEVGWDGALTAVVDVNGYLIADCEGRDVDPPGAKDYGAAEANARHIIRAVQVLDAMIRWRAELEAAIRDEPTAEEYRWALRHLDKAGV